MTNNQQTKEEFIEEAVEKLKKEIADKLVGLAHDVAFRGNEVADEIMELAIELQEEARQGRGSLTDPDDGASKVSDCCGADVDTCAKEGCDEWHCQKCSLECDVVEDPENQEPKLLSDCCEAPIEEDIKTEEISGIEAHKSVFYCTGCGDKCGIKTKEVDTDRMKEIFEQKRELDDQRIEPLDERFIVSTIEREIMMENREKINELVDAINEIRDELA